MPDIHISRIDPHPANVREGLGDLTGLRDSIRVHGILQPLVVQPHPDKPRRYQLLAGHRRLAAFKRIAANTAGLDMVPCVVRKPPAGASAARAIEIMLVENCQRRDLSPVEKAEAMGALLNHGLTAADIARRTGLHPSTVSGTLALLDLDETTRARIEAGTVRVTDALRAVRQTRKAARRGGAPARRRFRLSLTGSTAGTGCASAASAMSGHTRRPLIGSVACGRCWEQAIREDHDAEPNPEPTLTAREERMQAIAQVKFRHTGPAAEPGSGPDVNVPEAAWLYDATGQPVEYIGRDTADTTP